jgi:flagellar hook-associated protein 1
VRADVLADPRKLASARFDPATPVGQPALGSGDGTGLNRLRDLVSTPVNFEAAGNLPPTRASLTSYVANVISDASLRAAHVTQEAEDAKALADAQVQKRDDYQGVNLDEELSQLVIYQNSYSASARLITTARELYDQLLSILQ